jgi:hypothetical protein
MMLVSKCRVFYLDKSLPLIFFMVYNAFRIQTGLTPVDPNPNATNKIRRTEMDTYILLMDQNI